MAMFRALMSLAITALLINLAMGANYTVGGEVGWNLGPNFQSWSAAQSFHVGDNLIFSYSPPHDLSEVTKANYESCKGTNALQVDTNGHTVITLTSPGNRYFICGFVSHCTTGMKLQVNTLAASTATPPPTSPEVAAPPVPTVATPPAIATPPLPNPPSLAPVKAPILAPTEAPLLAPVPSALTPIPSPSESPAVTPSGSSSSTTSPKSSASGNRGYLLSKLTTGIWFGMLILLAL